MPELFTLSWDDFHKKCPKAFRDLWLDTDLSDVTLATEDNGQISAHKVILAACSPLFKRLLQKNPNGHPLLYLMGVQLSQLQQLLSYIYLGQCDLTQDQLPAFMATGKQLEIEGLTRDAEEESKESHAREVFEEKAPNLIMETFNQAEPREEEEAPARIAVENISVLQSEEGKEIVSDSTVSATDPYMMD